MHNEQNDGTPDFNNNNTQITPGAETGSQENMQQQEPAVQNTAAGTAENPFANLPPQPKYPQPPVLPNGAFTPPPGTYPANGAAPVAQAPLPGTPVTPQKVRKVGTITTALCLIAIGLLLALRVFLPNINYLLIARLSPLILVFLGAEMIIAAARYRDEKLRYDFLSIILSLFLIAGSMAAALIPEAIYISYESDRIGSRISSELENTSAKALQNINGITYTNVEWYVNVQHSKLQENSTAADLTPDDYIQVRVRMQSDFASKKEFVEACKTSLDTLSALVPHLDYASFYSYNDKNDYGIYDSDIRYSLWLENEFQLNNGVEDLEKLVHTEYWLPSKKYYLSEWEYNDMLKNPEDYGIYPDEPPFNDDDYADAPPTDAHDDFDPVDDAA